MTNQKTKQVFIFESPDNGKTIYVRHFRKHNKKILIGTEKNINKSKFDHNSFKCFTMVYNK